MKKIFLFASMGLFLLSLNANAQDKEALKAQKAAMKEAKAILKKAKTCHTTAIPNLQYGRKETNFERLDEAKGYIDQAVTNQYLVNDAETWKVAADIYSEYFKKYEEQAKLDESVKPQLVATASKVVEYAIKCDSLTQLDEKAKDAQKTLINEQYRNLASNPLLQCLQASQNYSNGETQEDFKLGYKYSSLVNRAFNESHLFSTFKNENLGNWKIYAKAFRAQSYAAIENADPAKIEEYYSTLYGTEYESVAYSSLINYYREKDKAKFLGYLKKAYENAKGETAPQFGFMYMQELFTNGDKNECIKVIDVLTQKYPDNDNAVNAYLMKGQIFFDQKKFDEAEKLFDEVCKKYPDDDRAITMPAKSAWMKAQASASKADRDHAINLFKELEAKYPNKPDYWGEPLYILYNNNNQLKLRDKYKKYYKG
ncbi:MAG: tetratricopeptide repeat protein [Bacteroidaceae bacterium]|nr:tetratricopeptide repeat protein [Bacteroidaceae bacterium]